MEDYPQWLYLILKSVMVKGVLSRNKTFKPAGENVRPELTSADLNCRNDNVKAPVWLFS